VVTGEFGRIASIAAAIAAAFSAFVFERLDETVGRLVEEVVAEGGARVKEVFTEAGREWRSRWSSLCFSIRLFALPQVGSGGACVVGDVGFEFESAGAREVPGDAGGVYSITGEIRSSMSLSSELEEDSKYWSISWSDPMSESLVSFDLALVRMGFEDSQKFLRRLFLPGGAVGAFGALLECAGAGGFPLLA